MQLNIISKVIHGKRLNTLQIEYLTGISIGEDMKITQEDFNTSIFCAFRYSLGRMTYISSTMTELILKYWSNINRRTRYTMIEEIKDAIDKDQAGMMCDVDQWSRILERDEE